MCGRVVIDTLKTLDWHPDQYVIDTQMTLDQQSIENGPSVDWLMYIDQRFVQIRDSFKCMWPNGFTDTPTRK